MAKKQIYNPISGKFDLIDEDIFIPSYNALLFQTSTNAPTDQIVGTNTLGMTITWEYVSVGLFRTNSLGILGTSAIVFGSGNGGILSFYKGGARIFVESRTFLGVLSDNILAGASIKIEIPQ